MCFVVLYVEWAMHKYVVHVRTSESATLDWRLRLASTPTYNRAVPPGPGGE